jgi:large subunit ribosomal protein L4
VLFVDADNHQLKLSTRNMPETKYVSADGINVYDVLDYDKLVLTKAALPEIIRRATGEAKA